MATGKTALSQLSWWPFVLLLLPIGLVVVSWLCDYRVLLRKSSYEQTAIPIIAAAAIAWGIRTVYRRERIALLVTAQAFIFTCREIHFPGTDIAVYVGTALVGGWALVWVWRRYDRLISKQTDWKMLSFLATSIACYVISLLVQRRVFKGVPGESELHIALEESTENMAHLLLLISSLIYSRRRAGAPNDQ
jgi:hypothetical protein